MRSNWQGVPDAFAISLAPVQRGAAAVSELEKEENPVGCGGKRVSDLEISLAFLRRFEFLEQPTKKSRISSEVRDLLLPQNAEVIT